jgi:glycine cleavage system aminomethyltransferase T
MPRSGKREVGSVTSATWSPTCKRNIALAMVDAPYFSMGSTVWADIYLNRELVWERRMSARADGGTSVLRAGAPARHAAGDF